MSSPTLLRRLIIGRRAFILSHVEFKRIILTGQLCIVVFFMTTGYAAYDVTSGFYASWPYQISCAVAALISFFLNRAGRHTLAKVLLAFASNVEVYIFAASEGNYTELHVFFIVISIATIAAFGYEQRYIATAFLVFTFVLYLATLFLDFQIVDQVNHNPEYLKNNRIINYVTALTAASLIVFALISVNFHSEKALAESEQRMAAKNEELTRLNVELDRFVYSSSHDLTAPLRSILGLLGLCNLTGDRDEQKKYLVMIKDRVGELERFIKEMSDYSKNASSAAMREKIEVKKLLHEVLETLRFYPDAEKLEVTLNLDDELIVLSDYTRMKVILSNIVSNCFKYSDIQKNNPFVRIAAEMKGDHLHIEICDNGLGIKETSLPRIFEMFYRAHDHSDGSGLGLYIVKETIEKLGGTIAVQSVVGEGTTFRIALPAPFFNGAS